MPTPTGLPKVGEVWELAIKLPGRPVEPQRVIVLERSGGEYWSMHVAHGDGRRALWVDCSYHLRQGWLRYLCPAGPETRRKLGLPPLKAREARELAEFRLEEARRREARD